MYICMKLSAELPAQSSCLTMKSLLSNSLPKEGSPLPSCFALSSPGAGGRLQNRATSGAAVRARSSGRAGCAPRGANSRLRAANGEGKTRWHQISLSQSAREGEEKKKGKKKKKKKRKKAARHHARAWPSPSSSSSASFLPPPWSAPPPLPGTPRAKPPLILAARCADPTHLAVGRGSQGGRGAESPAPLKYLRTRLPSRTTRPVRGRQQPESRSSSSRRSHRGHPRTAAEGHSSHMPAHLLQDGEFSPASSTTTITSRVTKNGNAVVEKDFLTHDAVAAERGMVDDLFDETYREKEGPRPPVVYVWRNIILMSLLHLGAIIGLTLIPYAKIQTLAWAILCFMLSALGITAGSHRLWSHRTYKATLPLRIFLTIVNSMAFQNDIFEWARDHRVHHKFSETDADPHNAMRGFFFSHIGWLLVRKHPDVIEKGQKLDLSDLKADKVVMFQRRYYKPSVVLLCFTVPTVVPWYFWDESIIISFFIPAILRYTLGLNATWLVNSAAHMFGNRPYDQNINPRENPLVSVGALGEGFHNYHHTFPYDYSASEYGWRFNLTTAFIDLMCLLGLASDRKRVSKEVIMARKMRTGDGSHKSG
uniref:stearoyl-CoA 9-desaturase n=2 Tax=Coturnix japonica TaxID=93934 RepID=A0A8C2YG13_COTJA